MISWNIARNVDTGMPYFTKSQNIAVKKWPCPHDTPSNRICNTAVPIQYSLAVKLALY